MLSILGGHHPKDYYIFLRSVLENGIDSTCPQRDYYSSSLCDFCPNKRACQDIKACLDYLDKVIAK